MTENWYLELELEFDPNPVTDENIIAERIEEKRKFWARKANDPTYGAKYKKYSKMIDTIKTDMIGEKNIRAELIKDACEKIYGPIDDKLKLINKPEISRDVIEKIAKKHKLKDIEIVERRARTLGIKITESQADDSKEIYDKYYNTKPQNNDKFNGMKKSLEVLGVDDLYYFLYKDKSVKNPRSLPSEVLLERAKQLRTTYTKHDSIDAAGRELCGYCDQSFKDENEKKLYDLYIEYNARKKILDSIKVVHELAGEISQQHYLNHLGMLTEEMKDKGEAEKLLVSFCKVEGILLPAAAGRVEKINPHIKVCRCGCINDTSDGRRICMSCGLDLQIKCPKCGSMNDTGINVCKCGFRFENMDKASAFCDLAEIALNDMDFIVAEAHLKDANQYWPGNKRAVELDKRLNELKGRVGSAVEDMKKACQGKHYFEAKKQLESVKKYAPNYENAVLEAEIENAIKTVEELKKKAETSKNEMEIIQACVKAYEICQDYPGIKEIIARYPPAAPSNISVVTDTSAKVNVISWEKSKTEGVMHYTVIRKEGAVPISIHDGTLVGRISMCSITDRNIMPGIEYFYAVFAERSGIYSDALLCKEAVINLFEISGVKVTSGDGSLQLSWELIADNASVEIERQEAKGKNTKLVCNNRSGFVDKELDNDTEYTYNIYLVYSIGIKKINTKGIEVKGIPTRPPLPIEKISVKLLQGNEFQVEWSKPENSEVQFFCTKKRTDYLCGDVVPIEDLESSLSALMLTKTTPNTGTFRYDDDALLYIVPVTVKSGSAVIGNIARTSQGGSVKINSISRVNGKIMINIDLPKAATGFVVLYRDDQFSTDIEDTQAVRKYIPLKQYQYDCGILIDSNESQNYYFSVFAEYRGGGECDYSAGSDFLFCNEEKQVITYSLNVNKKLFGGNKLNITFECEDKKFSLPAIDMVSAQGRAPMFKNNNKVLYQIEEQEAKDGEQFSFPIDKQIPRETYVKPFLRDESMADRYIFKLKVGSTNKIS